MAKPQQFTLEIGKRASRDSDPAVGDPFEIIMPPFTEEDDEGNERTLVEGRTLKFAPPNLSRFMSLQISYELSESQFDIISNATAMLYSGLKNDDRAYVRRRFNNPEDPFGLDNIADMVMLMMETWSARPTKKASGSSSSRAKRGSTSTPEQPSPEETSSEN